MLDAQVLWLICAAGFILLAVAVLSLSRAVWIDRKELKELRKRSIALQIRILDLEKTKAKGL